MGKSENGGYACQDKAVAARQTRIAIGEEAEYRGILALSMRVITIRTALIFIDFCMLLH
jgi:hypothetical protein